MSVLARIGAQATALSSGEIRVSAAELQDQCASIIEFLRQQQLTRVALLADNAIDWISVDLACQEANICLVPLPTFFSPQQIRHVLASCAIRAVITDRPELLAELAGQQLEFPLCTGTSTLHCVALAGSADAALLPAGTGKITFTSGSTGQPKGVCLSSEHLVRQAQRLSDAVALDRPRHLCLLPLSTLLENVAGVYAPLLARGEVCVPHPAHLGFSGSALADPQLLLRQIKELAPHTLILIPQLLSLLVGAAAQGWQAPKSLKFVAVGGARVSSQAILAARAAGIPVYEGYGLSECASVVSLNTIDNDKPGSCGKPLPGLGIRLEAGEIIISGSAMLGYVNDQPSWNPAEIGSGDAGEVDAQGFLRINGRLKNMLISSYGRNISPEWVESELLANPLITEAIVIGDALPFCAALIAVRSPNITDASVQEWIDSVNSKLPDYARVQRWLRLAIPLTANPRFMTENGRPRRDIIDLAFQQEIQQLYGEPELNVAASAAV